MFIGYFSSLAYELAKWAMEEEDRNTALRVWEKADEIEIKHRHKKGISLDHKVWWYKPYVNQFEYAHLCLRGN